MKKCNKCKVNKDFCDFSKSKSRKDGLNNTCKLCAKEAVKEWRQNNKFNGRIVASKHCAGCKSLNPSDNFYKDKSRVDGLSSQCKDCIKVYRLKNREKILEAQRVRNKLVSESEKIQVTGRTCSQCKEYKSSDSFWKSKHTKDGLYSCCVVCKKKLESTEHRQAVRKKNQKDWISVPENKVKTRNKWNNWDKHKRDTDIGYRLRRNVMHAICSKMQGRSFEKEIRLQKAIFEHLPYTAEELKKHIELQWETWMNWENYGKHSYDQLTWQIDHIIPQSKMPFDSFEDSNFKELWSLDNLRPLETIANIKKGNKESLVQDN